MRPDYLLFNDAFVFSRGLPIRCLRAGNHWQGRHDLYVSSRRHAFFVNYETSFGTPTFFNLSDPKYGNPDVDPEEGRTAKRGIRQELLDKRLDFDIAY